MTPAIAPRWRIAIEPWVAGFVLGTCVGFVVLGIGGRIAMRAIAVATNTPPGFSTGGTATVAFLGAVSGVGGGLLYALLYRLVPRARFVRRALFGVALVLLTLRGLRPIQPLALEWFLPLALGYGAIVDVAYTAWYRRRVRGSALEGASANRAGYSGRA